MRPRASVTGPLILIGVGALFLIHTISPNFRIDVIFGDYWPYFLIAWGVIQLIEISIRAARGFPVPAGGISGGGWFIAILICLLGWSTFEFRRADTWWRRVGFAHGAAMFGDERFYAIPSQTKPVGKKPRIVLEDFRGDAKISGSDTSDITLQGRKTVRSLSMEESDRTNGATPVEVVQDGDSWVIRCHQERAGRQNLVTTNLELTVPKGATVQASGTVGDFDVSSIEGSFELKSGNAGVRLEDVSGGVKLDTGKSDSIRCERVNGSVDIRGRGDDIDLLDIAGPINVSGDYSGSLTITHAAKPVHIQTMRKQLTLAAVPGTIKLDRGNMEGDNLSGPIEMSARSTDVSIHDWTNSLELQIDRGDVSIDCSHKPSGAVKVSNASGDIALVFPGDAQFRISAHTGNGTIDNEFAGSIQEETHGHGASLQAALGSGPDVELSAQRGDISIRKGDGHGGPPPPPAPPAPDVKPPKVPAVARDIV